MSNTTPAVQAFISAYDGEPLAYQNLDNAIEAVCCGKSFRNLILALVNGPAFSKELGQEFAAADAIAGLSACRSLRSWSQLLHKQIFWTAGRGNCRI